MNKFKNRNHICRNNAVSFSRSSGEKGDSPEGQKVLNFFSWTKLIAGKDDKERNEVERLFCRLKRFRRIATRYEKLDVIFVGIILFAMIIDSLV